jgi:hypothetical protein
MAFGIYMSPTNPDELGSANNPLLVVLGGDVVIALVAISAAGIPALANWSHRCLALAATAAGLIVAAFVAEMASAAFG